MHSRCQHQQCVNFKLLQLACISGWGVCLCTQCVCCDPCVKISGPIQGPLRGGCLAPSSCGHPSGWVFTPQQPHPAVSIVVSLLAARFPRVAVCVVGALAVQGFHVVCLPLCRLPPTVLYGTVPLPCLKCHALGCRRQPVWGRCVGSRSGLVPYSLG